ncbi:MAG: alpha/beta hydrolase domain-containing protein, partial [Candidatus Rokuibacteriota bacterium]
RPNARVDVLPLADRYHIPHPVARLDDPEAELHVREHGDAPAATVPRSAWRFPDSGSIALDGGFQPGRIYDCYYRAENPPVVGLGFTAVRDTASFLRWGTAAEGNPCAGAIERSYVFGVSQSGRFLRHLLYLGLDEDEAGRFVWDAVIPHVAGARRGEFNCRFGQPSLNAVHAVGSLFPFTDGEQDDPVTGQRDALLRRLAGRAKPPHIFTINTSAEYWRGDGSLVHTDVGGARDVTPPPHVRQYLFAGSQHTPGALPPPAADPNTGGRGFHPFSVVDYSPLLRAALVNLDRWVTEGVEPPPSAVPRVADGTAVAAEATRGVYAAIPGARFPDHIQRPQRLDFGPAVVRGIATLPPKQGAPFVTFVSAVDGDGNERAGIRPPELRVPLATFMGWNPRHPEQGAPGDIMAMMGSTLAFPRTAGDRARTGDARLSIEERYAGREAYLARVRQDAGAMVAARQLLAEDVDAVVERAGALWDFVCPR